MPSAANSKRADTTKSGGDTLAEVKDNKMMKDHSQAKNNLRSKHVVNYVTEIAPDEDRTEAITEDISIDGTSRSESITCNKGHISSALGDGEGNTLRQGVLEERLITIMIRCDTDNMEDWRRSQVLWSYIRGLPPSLHHQTQICRCYNLVKSPGTR